jgi:hypothetical protein
MLLNRFLLEWGLDGGQAGHGTSKADWRSRGEVASPAFPHQDKNNKVISGRSGTVLQVFRFAIPGLFHLFWLWGLFVFLQFMFLEFVGNGVESLEFGPPPLPPALGTLLRHQLQLLDCDFWIFFLVHPYSQLLFGRIICSIRSSANHFSSLASAEARIGHPRLATSLCLVMASLQEFVFFSKEFRFEDFVEPAIRFNLLLLLIDTFPDQLLPDLSHTRSQLVHHSINTYQKLELTSILPLTKPSAGLTL